MAKVINHYIEGETIDLQARFSKKGVLEDPTTITLKVNRPGATTPDVYTYADGEVTRVETGVYDYSVKASEPGLWWYRWIATGNVEAVGEWKFDVKPSHID